MRRSISKATRFIGMPKRGWVLISPYITHAATISPWPIRHLMRSIMAVAAAIKGEVYCRLFLLGDTVPQTPGGFNAFRGQTYSFEKKSRAQGTAHTSVHPSRRSGCSPALPYPPDGYDKINANKFIIQIRNAFKKK